MISYNTIFIIIVFHFIADFLLQNDKMALNKSTSLYWLGIHSIVYSIIFLYFGIQFALITCGAHFIIDFVSSKATTYFWKRKERHWFFATIGWDQLLHYVCLLTTYRYLN